MKLSRYIFVFIFLLIVFASSALILLKPNYAFLGLNIVDPVPQKLYAMSPVLEEGVFEQKDNDKKIIKVFIDPGHNAKVTGAFGPIGAEHEMTYKVSKHLADILDKDKRFEYELSRYEADSKEYSTNITSYGASNRSKLRSIITTKVAGEQRGGLSVAQYTDMYSIRHYAIENDFDVLVSIHFDVIGKRYYNAVEGFHVIASPYNRVFDKSFELASIISSNFSEMYKVSRGTRHDHNLHKSVWDRFDKNDLLDRGISLRSLVVIGDVFEHTYYNKIYSNDQSFISNLRDIPSVLIETGYLHETKFTNESTLKDVAQRIYSSISELF